MQSQQTNSPNASFNYGMAIGNNSTNPFITIISERDPTSNDFNYPVKQRWINTSGVTEWILIGFDNSSGQSLANWLEIAPISLQNGIFSLQNLITIQAGVGSPNGLITASIGSLFLRIDPNDSSSRVYINTDGSTTWTNLICAS